MDHMKVHQQPPTYIHNIYVPIIETPSTKISIQDSETEVADQVQKKSNIH